MYNIIQHSHSGIMWLVMATLILSVIFSFLGFIKTNEACSPKLFKLYYATKLLVYIQFILGGILLFVSPKIHYGSGFMKDSDLRFYGMEHPLMMIIAVGLIAFGLFKSKKKPTDAKKNKTVFIYYTIALIVIVLMIPWKAVLS